MLVCNVRNIVFNLNRNEHIVSYAERATAIVDLFNTNSEARHGSIKAVIVNDLAEAAVKLNELVKVYLKEALIIERQFSYNDFEFQIYYIEVENNEFWLIPHCVELKKHKIK
jgi:hypothetical protein